MKQWEKDILERQMKNESVAIWQLEKVYNKAHQDSLEKLAILKGKEPTPSIVRQVAFQEEITSQLSTVYDDLYKKSYVSVKGFLDTGAEDAFYGALYSLNKQGIPMAFPLPTDEIAQITMINPSTGFKLSDKLYKHTELLGKKVKEEISRGLATDLSYQEIANNLKRTSEANYKQSVRIARTEGHRVNGEVSFMAMDKAKKAGADIVKQWDATLDKRTRDSHASMDGQIRELEEKFVSGDGEKTMYQGGFGIAKEDIQCRCVVLQRARWMLEDGGTPPTKWDGVNKELIELKEKDYDGFKKAVKKLNKDKKIKPPVVPPIPDIPDVIEPEPPASTLREKIDAMRVDGGSYTKEQLMEAGKLIVDDIKLNPDNLKFVNNADEIKKQMEDIREKLKPFRERQSALYSAFSEKHNELMEAYQKHNDYQRYIKESNALKEAHNLKYDAITGEMRSMRDELNALQVKLVKENDSKVFKNAEFTKAKLAEIRGVGDVSMERLSTHMNDSRSPVKLIISNAYDVYPTDWIEKSIAKSNLTPKKVKRGYYDEWSRTIALSGEGSSAYSTAIHELGHRFEMAVPEILKAEKEFYDYRTAGEKAKWLGGNYARSETTRVDHFITPYIGKDYGESAYELVSMGFQYAFTDTATLLTDEEYATWIYGILALY